MGAGGEHANKEKAHADENFRYEKSRQQCSFSISDAMHQAQTAHDLHYSVLVLHDSI